MSADLGQSSSSSKETGVETEILMGNGSAGARAGGLKSESCSVTDNRFSRLKGIETSLTQNQSINPIERDEPTGSRLLITV